MELLTKAQEDNLRVILFKARYKMLKNEGLSPEEMLVQAIAETSDDKIKLEDYPEIVEEWLRDFKKGKNHETRMRR